MRRMKFIGARFVVFGIVSAAIIGLVIAGLWNALMPAIFGLPAIGFWQALGLLLLSRVLFGRFGWGSRMRKTRFVRGLKDLTPEERQRFRHAMGSRCERIFGEGEAAKRA